MAGRMDAVRRQEARRVLGVAGGAHAIHDGLSDTIYLLLPLWARTFGLGHSQVGLLKSLYAGALASFQLPAGLLAERLGERYPLVLGTIVVGLAYIGLGQAGGFIGLASVLVIAGLGSGTQHPLSSSLVSQAYPGTGRRAALGTYNFTGDIGKVVMPAAVGALAAVASWRDAAQLAGLLGIVAGLALLWGLVAAGLGARPVPSQQRERSAVRGFGITRTAGFSALSGVAIADNAVRTGFFTFLPFLLVDLGAEVETLGIALALTFAGGAAGKLACGHLAERLGVVRTVVATEIATALGIAALTVVSLDTAFFLLPLVGLALNGTSSVLYGTVADFVAADRQARAFGLFYTLGLAAGALAPFGFGLLSDRVGIEPTLLAIGGTALLTLPACGILAGALPEVEPAP